MISFLVFFTGFLSLAWISVQDWRTEKFNALIPIAALVFYGFLSVLGAGFSFGAGFYVNLLFFGILIAGSYLRLGDILPLLIYTAVYNSTQSFFTLLTVMGLYLYTYPKIKNGESDWIPFIPAILTVYLIQTLATLI